MTSNRNFELSLPIMQGSPPPPEWQPPAENWDRAPWNRWSFQNVRMCVPTEEIARGAKVTAWGSAPRDLTGLSFEAFSGKSATLNDLLSEFADGFLVAHHGRIVHESYHNGMTRHTPHLVMSVSKSITATIAGILIDQGRIEPAVPVTNYLPELATTGWNGANVQQVLDMTTGVAFVEDYDDPDCDIARLEYSSGWKPVPAGLDGADWADSIWGQILGLTDCEAKHGERFKYRSIETNLLGVLIARVTGRSLARTISDLLWAPMGAESAAYITVDREGTALADGGICATLRDLARFGQTMLDQGRAGDAQVIPQSWVQDVRTGNHGRFDDQSREFMPNGRYRNMFWIRDVAQPIHLSLGIYGQFIYVSPADGLVVVCLSSWPDALSDDGHSDTIRAIDAIAQFLR
ncbi:MAG: serine hydrolase [Rhodobacteraceae bacterium]|nr:serine hydrolase [Paracoccaceae bacterium]